MKIYLILFLVIVLYGCNNSPKISLTNPSCDDLEGIELNNTLIFFDSKGYLNNEDYLGSPSKKLKEEILKDSVLISEINNKLNFIVITYECENAKKIISKYEITNFPTIIKTDNKSNEIFRNIGLTTSSSLRRKLFEKSDKERPKIIYRVSYPKDTVSWSIYEPLSDFWEIKSGSINIFNISIDDNEFIYFNSSGSWGYGDNYETRKEQYVDIVRHRRVLNTFDFYIDKKNNITFRKLIYKDENDNLLKNIEYESEVFHFKTINKNEIKIYDESKELVLVRDTLDNWKK
ncbi:hypothetical protein [Flavivirga jejuensis]|uniref:Uncharacterized protein n=1 Tax=Flavivirga jejuensis TaxID=870487 RepID=A0ABT8WIE9_9FLAO|nr:hypothetical protein [Flavivirga jejuensis]MDO5972789.1 hypothetical protein [Flavivirga jejuensis]